MAWILEVYAATLLTDAGARNARELIGYVYQNPELQDEWDVTSDSLLAHPFEHHSEIALAIRHLNEVEGGDLEGKAVELADTSKTVLKR